MMKFKITSLIKFQDSEDEFLPIHTKDDPAILTFPENFKDLIATLSILYGSSDRIHEHLKLALGPNESGMYQTDENGNIVFRVSQLKLKLEFLSIKILNEPNFLSNFDKNTARLQVKIESLDGLDEKSKIFRNTNLDVSTEISALCCGQCYKNPQIRIITLEKSIPYFPNEIEIILQCGAKIYPNDSNDFPIRILTFDDLPCEIRELYCPKFRKKWINPRNIQCSHNPTSHVTSNIGPSLENRKKKSPKNEKDDEVPVTTLDSCPIEEENDQLPKGLFLLIHIDTFKDNHPYREGSSHDYERIKKFFTEQLHYEFHESVNKTTFDLKADLDDFHEAITPDCQQIVTFVLSHGYENGFFTYDGQMEFQELQSNFLPKNCLNLINKPQIYFYGCCRQNPKNYIGDKDEKDAERKSKRLAPQTFMGFASLKGELSYRDPSSGSIFVKELFNVIGKGPHREIREIFDEVKENMKNLETHKGHRHIADFEHNLTGEEKIYLTLMKDDKKRNVVQSEDGSNQQVSSDPELVKHKECGIYFSEASSDEHLNKIH